MDRLTYAKVGGVLSKDLFLAIAVKSKTEGHIELQLPNKVSRMMTKVTPAHPMFF